MFFQSETVLHIPRERLLRENTPQFQCLLIVYVHTYKSRGKVAYALSHTHTHTHFCQVVSGSHCSRVISEDRILQESPSCYSTTQAYLPWALCVCHLWMCGFSPPNCFFQLQGILQRWVLMVCLQSVPVRVPSLVPRPQSPSLATHTLHCHSPQSDLRSFLPVKVGAHTVSYIHLIVVCMKEKVCVCGWI